MKKSRIIFSAVILILCLLGVSWLRWVTIDPNKPESVLAAIDQRGAHWIMADSNEYHDEWEIMMRNIASGQDNWLEVFKKLASESDAHPAEDLSIALSKAILSNPQSVLEILNDSTFTRWISYSCGTVDAHMLNDHLSELEFLKEQREKVSSVNDSRLSVTKAKCLESIDAKIKEMN